MNFVESCPGDLSVQDVARLAGRSVKTVRRAVHAGQLPMRYVLGLRGPQLVFQPEEIERWHGQRIAAGVASTRSGRHRSRRPARRKTSSIPKAAMLLALAEEQRSMVAFLTERLSYQEVRIDTAQQMLAELSAQLATLVRQEQHS
jgi:Helix-turn-helix domain